MTGLLAAVAGSLAGWLTQAVLGGHVPETAEYLLSFLVSSFVFVATYAWIKRLRDGL
jgi:hypothetical protein